MLLFCYIDIKLLFNPNSLINSSFIGSINFLAEWLDSRFLFLLTLTVRSVSSIKKLELVKV